MHQFIEHNKVSTKHISKLMCKKPLCLLNIVVLEKIFTSKRWLLSFLDYPIKSKKQVAKASQKVGKHHFIHQSLTHVDFYAAAVTNAPTQIVSKFYTKTIN